MARAPSGRIAARSQTGGRPAAERLQLQSTSAASEATSRIGAISQGVLERLGSAANRVVQDRTGKQYESDLIQGQAGRTQEIVQGQAAQQEEQMLDRSDAYRRGYRITEAANRVHEVQTSLTRRMASMEPDQDPTAVIDEELSALISDKSFQDPQVMRRLQPVVQQTREQALVQYEKVERAELLERQVENLTSMARVAVQNGEMGTHEQIGKFLTSVDTEEYGFIDQDMGLDIVADAIRDRLETGSIDPDNAEQFLKTQMPGTGTTLWDRKDQNGNAWSDQFDAAAKAGRTTIAKEQANAIRNAMAGDEFRFQRMADRGQMTDSTITRMADKYGLDGAQRHEFNRYWFNQNQAGIKAMEAAAKAAREKQKISFGMMTQNVNAYTTEQLQNAARDEYKEAVLSGNRDLQQAIITRATRVGAIVPQVRDMMSRTTRDNIAQNHEVFRSVVAADPVVAQRYITDDQAVMFDTYHKAVAEWGATPQEALAYIPTGANKATRQDAEGRVREGARDFFRDEKNLKLSDGTKLTPQMQQEAIRRATAMAVASPHAQMETLLPLAVRRTEANYVNVNGTWVPSGQMRKDEASVLTELAKRAGKELVEGGHLPAAMAEKLTFVPDPTDPATVVLMRPDMLLQTHPKTERPVTFNVRRVASAKAAHEEALALHAAQPKGPAPSMARPPSIKYTQGVPAGLASPEALAAGRAAVGGRYLSPTLQALAPPPALQPAAAAQADKAPTEDFVEFLNTFKPKGK